MGHWFFLNYSRSDASPYLDKFFKDLVDQVRQKAGISANVPDEEIGFRDTQEIKYGQPWPQRIVEGLQGCRAVVSGFSPGFFKSDYCGREFEVFRSRLAAYRKETPPPLIFPVLWEVNVVVKQTLMKKVPYIQYTHETAHPDYAKEGLCYLIMRDQTHDAYRTFLHHFAKAVVDEAQKHQVPSLHPFPLLTEIKSSWDNEDVPLPAVVPGATIGPGVVRFFFLVGNPQDYAPIRSPAVVPYDPRGARYWRPFDPDATDEVGYVSQGAAHRAKCQSDVEDVTHGLIDAIRRAEETNTIVFIVVDPWSVKVQSLRQYLNEYDRQQFLNTAVIVAWNEKDPETAREKLTLVRELKGLLTRNARINKACLKDSVTTVDQLEGEILTTIHEIRKRLQQETEYVSSQLEGDAPRALPLLSASSEEKL